MKNTSKLFLSDIHDDPFADNTKGMYGRISTTDKVQAYLRKETSCVGNLLHYLVASRSFLCIILCIYVLFLTCKLSAWISIDQTRETSGGYQPQFHVIKYTPMAGWLEIFEFG